MNYCCLSDSKLLELSFLSAGASISLSLLAKVCLTSGFFFFEEVSSSFNFRSFSKALAAFLAAFLKSFSAFLAAALTSRSFYSWASLSFLSLSFRALAAASFSFYALRSASLASFSFFSFFLRALAAASFSFFSFY